MDFSFLHAADLHLGSPFLGLSSNDEELARRVAAASREAFEELVDQAISRQVKFVVIAGDIYDGDWKDTTIGHFLIGKWLGWREKEFPSIRCVATTTPRA